MSNEKKIPTECNNCNSSNIIFHIWGRSEFYSCNDCKKEVTYIEKSLDIGSPWGIWGPGAHGSNSNVDARELRFNLPHGYKFPLDDWSFDDDI